MSQLFFQGASIDMRDTDKIYVNKLLFCFLLLIYLSSQKSQPRTQKDREKIIFPPLPSDRFQHSLLPLHWVLILAPCVVFSLGEARWLKPPTIIVTICMSCFIAGGPGKEQGTYKPPPTRRVWERSKGDTTCPTTSQNPSLWHPAWLNKVWTIRKDSESEWLAKDNRETKPITIKPETASPVTEQFSWVLLPYCSPSRCPFTIKSLALSAHVSPRTIHFWVLDKSPVSGPGRGPPSCNILIPQCLGFFFLKDITWYIFYTRIYLWNITTNKILNTTHNGFLASFHTPSYVILPTPALSSGKNWSAFSHYRLICNFSHFI